MRFADLNDRDKNRDAPKLPGRGKKTAQVKAEAQPFPLDSPIPDFPSIRTASPVPPVPDSRLPTPDSQLAAPDSRLSTPAPRLPAQSVPLSRKDTQRKDEAEARAAERPFLELDPQAKEIYTRALSLAKELLTQINRPYVDKCEHFIGLADLIAGALPENPAILRYTAYATADNYLYAHSANVAILSQAVGLAMGLEKSEVSTLGFCALTHDIGMTAHSQAANLDRRLTDAEYAAIMLHSGEGADKIDRLMNLAPRLKERARKVISQVHERIDAGGYPARLIKGEIDLLAQIIGIVDVYEAITHPRAWRPAAHPHDAIKRLIDKEDKGFDSGVVKAVIRALSIYPPGSLVALSSGEIAEVVKVNRQSMTRPVVSILLDQDFEPETPRLIDLMAQPLSGIETIVQDATLAAHNPKFAARRELARWWVEW